MTTPAQTRAQRFTKADVTQYAFRSFELGKAEDELGEALRHKNEGHDRDALGRDIACRVIDAYSAVIYELRALAKLDEHHGFTDEAETRRNRANYLENYAKQNHGMI